MRRFCEASPLPSGTGMPARPTFFHPVRWLLRRLWRQEPAPSGPVTSPAPVPNSPWSHDPSSRQPPAYRGQRSPYWMCDVGPLRLVAIDAGILGHIDAKQGAWLRRASEGDRPKILLTGKPLYVDGTNAPGPILDGGTVDAIVREPTHRYVAVVGGDIHNYQRYPITRGGRTLNYIVSGGGGAFMHATYKVRDIDTSEIAHVTSENEVRMFPSRGDSLYEVIFHHLPARLRSRLCPTRDEASALLARRLGISPR